MATETVQAVNIGSAPNSGDGEQLRHAVEIFNANDALLFQLVSGILAGIDPDRNSLKKIADLIAGFNNDPELAALRNLTSAADQLPYFTGPGTAALATLTSFARGLMAAVDGAGARNALGLIVGTNVQAWDSDLDAIAALATTAIGRSLLAAVDAGALRNILALGTAAVLAAGLPGGAATLDSSTGKLLAAQIPDVLLGAVRYQGVWNASTNSPALPTPAAANKGFYYIVNVAGTTSLTGPNGPIADWQLGDWAVSDGTSWEKVDSSDQVLRVAGLQGDITPAALKGALALVIGDISGLSAALAALAPLASPSLTGAPSAPTPALGDSSTRLSTTAFVAGAIAALGLGTAATKNVGTAANNVVQLDGGARLPAVDASQLLNVPGTTGASVTMDDFRTLAIQVAKLKGSTVGMAGGVADDFRDQTGYDTANSVSVYYDAASSTLSNNGIETTQSLPAMTSNTAPTGYTATSSTPAASSTEAAWKAFDGSLAANGSGLAWTSTAAAPQWLQRVNPTAFRMGSYDITTRGDGFGLPSAWTLHGTNDGGTTLVLLDTQTGQAFGSAQTKTYTIPAANRGSYTGYRLTVTATSANNPAVAELRFYKEITGTLDLISAPYAAQAVPTKGSIFVLVKATADTITANSNLLAKLSRDGGASYTTATLTSTGTLSSGYAVYEANGFDISGQPSGSSMKWRLQTVGTALAVQVDAVVAQWG